MSARMIQRELKMLKRKLDRFDKEYQEAFQEWTADKAAGSRNGQRPNGQRPRKSRDHIELEIKLQELENTL